MYASLYDDINGKPDQSPTRTEFFFDDCALDRELHEITNIVFVSVMLIVNSLKAGQCNFYHALFKFVVPTTAPVPTTGED